MIDTRWQLELAGRDGAAWHDLYRSYLERVRDPLPYRAWLFRFKALQGVEQAARSLRHSDPTSYSALLAQADQFRTDLGLDIP